MSDPSDGGPDQPEPKATPSADMEFRRYEARLGVWKVALGTGIVGLAGVLIPGAVSFYSALADSQRQAAELRLAKETAHQEYIKEFFTTAINQDIELRIRFANYFANLSDPEQQKLWRAYLDVLTTQKKETRDSINTLERRLVDLKKAQADVSDTATYDEVSRELEWTYAEVGYVPINRSVVKPPASKKERLYSETIAVAKRLAAQQTNLDPQSGEYLRFWELYEDLIGTESSAFSRQMVRIGIVLRKLVAPPSPPTDELRELVEELSILAKEELDAEAQSGVKSPSRSTSQSLMPSQSAR